MQKVDHAKDPQSSTSSASSSPISNHKTSFKRKINRLVRDPIWVSIAALFVSVGGFVWSIYIDHQQAVEFVQTQNSREIDYVLNFDDRLNRGKNYEIGLALEHKRILLKQNGGRFSNDELDAYLSLYNQLYDTYDKGLISYELMDNNFSDGLRNAWQSIEIQAYLTEIRKIDEYYFKGLDYLAELFIK